MSGAGSSPFGSVVTAACNPSGDYEEGAFFFATPQRPRQIRDEFDTCSVSHRAILAAGLRQFGVNCCEIYQQRQRTRCAVFRVETTAGSFAAKMYPAEFDIETLRGEISLITKLGVILDGVPHYQRTCQGELFAFMPGGGYLALYNWLPGTPLESVRSGHVRAVAQLLRKMHAVLRTHEPIRTEDRWVWRDMERLSRRIIIPRPLAAWVRRVVRSGRPWRIADARSFCHNDLSPSNMLLDPVGRKISLIDFTNAIPAPPSWDVAIFWTDFILAGACTDAHRRNLGTICRVHGHTQPASRTFRRLVEVAAVQRAIFRCFTAPIYARMRIWRRLNRLRTSRVPAPGQASGRPPNSSSRPWRPDRNRCQHATR